ncbi:MULTISPECIES: hypothetical protein [unclassified Ochrobactrum]|uniref:hypothetical protein n=1 Tax=unclassified Ochrobactrum TaxID=239106 RepID=UPI002570B409|nr:hypothetical protein [Ochrobactrum sp. 3-3]
MSDKYAETPRRKAIVILGRRIPMPQSVMMRRMLGGSLVVGGSLGFLPILGFWMLPLGFIVLSHDSHRVRRWRRRSEIHIWRKWLKRKPADASAAPISSRSKHQGDSDREII